ncbi:MAG: YidC/Oxa1 family membrane protein insertase [Defluviitaleaceae bacterium]|nr:YidC/Oxa1 family membrane protein insertase [Defluviitaleaceae bacterium]
MNIFNTSRMVQTEPGFIVGPISSFLGFILDFIFNLINGIAGPAALGISIIIFTIIIRALLLPLAIKMNKSMEKMQILKPQIDAINKKYEGKKDAESNRAKGLEIQKLYSENGVNPLGGCLPAILQMPIFITLFNMFQMPYLYINELNQIYSRIAYQIMRVPNFYTYIQNTPSIGINKIPTNMPELMLTDKPDLLRLFNSYTSYDWQTLLNVLPTNYYDIDYVNGLLNIKDGMEHFLTISLIQPAGLTFPGVILPVFAAATTYFTSRMMMQKQMSTATVEQGTINPMQMQQKIMMYAMPIMMGAITVTSPAAVGLYWVSSNLFQIGQHYVLNKISQKKQDK